MYTGETLVSNLWQAIGVVILLAAVVAVIWTNFLGREKNIPRGIGLLVAVGVCAVIAQNPNLLLSIGNTVKDIFGIGG